MNAQMDFLELTSMLYEDKIRGEDRGFNERLLALQADVGQRGIFGSTVAYQLALKEYQANAKNLVSMYIEAMNEARDRLDFKPSAEHIANLASKGEQIIDGEWNRWKGMLTSQFHGSWFNEIARFNSEQKARVHTNARLLRSPLLKEERRRNFDNWSMVDPAVRVFISSTIQDLQEERASVVRAIRMLRQQPVFSESFGAQSDSPDQVIFDRLDTCHVYVGIFGSRYGSVPNKAEGKSVTHMEFERARELDVDILVFEQAGVTDREPKLVELLKHIKEYREGHLVERFDTVDELEEKVEFAVLGLLARRFIARSKDRVGNSSST